MEDFSKYLMRGETPCNEDPLPLSSCGEKSTHTPLFGKDILRPPFEASVFPKESFQSSHDKADPTYRKIDCHQSKGEVQAFSIIEEISQLESDIENVLCQVREGDSKNFALSKHVNKNSLFLKKVEKLVNKIEENYEGYKKQSQIQKPVYYAHDLRFQDGVDFSETSCMRSVRELCEEISSNFSKEYLSDPHPSRCEAGKGDPKEDIKTYVKELLHKHHPSEIFEALSKNIRQSTDNLNELCSRIDLQRDAANLKLKFETGKLKDVSSGPDLLKTVNQLIEMGQVAHFQQYVSYEASKNESFLAQKKLVALNMEIDSLLEEKLDPSLAPVMRRYLHAEQEASSSKTAQQFLVEEISKLKEEEKEKEAVKENIKSKYESIQNFDKTAQRKQIAIQKLVQANGSAKSRHRQQQGELLQLVEDKILQKKYEISEAFRNYHESLNEEIDLFAKLPLQSLDLLGDSDERNLISKMSINSLKPHLHQTGGEAINQILTKANFPSHHPPEKLLEHFIDMHSRSHQEVSELTEKEMKTKEMKDLHARLDTATEELGKLYQQDFQGLVSDLKRSEERMTEVMGTSLKFRSAVQTWWHQPAQFQVPWVSVNSSNLQEYNDRFAKQGELLKQLRDQHQKR